MFLIIFSLLSFTVFPSGACPDDGQAHIHVRHHEPSASLPLPSRPLVWGDVNIIHTTDSHGWLLGHQKPSFPEPNYSGDFGDFASFVAHMKEAAEEKDVDLLLVDSGDLHDGTGLTDGFPPGGVDAHEANRFFTELPYDILAIGNHELYIYANTLDMYQNFVPKYHGRYLSSNANITVPGPDGTPISVPVGSRFAKFRTRKGRKVISLGVLFDFIGNAANTTVQKVEDMVKEAWFAEAIKEEPDFFLLVGHMPVSRDNWPIVFNAVRAVHPTTPILILGGHSHIRDCVQLDGRSIALESGRYMETVGFLSVDLDQKGSTKNLTVNRRYLDPNRVTYEFHTNRKSSEFDTFKGQRITEGLNALAERFNLSFKFGTAPHDYYLNRAPYLSNGSLLNLMMDKVLPTVLAIDNLRAHIPNIIIANSGSLRFDVLAGPFTRNDQLTASPFSDTFRYIAGVPLGVASAVLPELNRGVEGRYRDWLAEMYARTGPELRVAENLTLGYVTQDACPGLGDDTLHTPLPFFSTPDYMSSTPPTGSSETEIDVVFDEFIWDDVLQILNKLQTSKEYTDGDVKLYTSILLNQVLGVFGEAEWN
ncbi:Metallo-dependent phosphatase-like protein [Lactifluus volemus]|nr:Metallo-dependent phosphatase-like protein [Lactifluus volemus]